MAESTLRKIGEDVSFAGAGVYLLKVTINDIEFFPQTIQALVIKEWVFDTLPRLDIIMTDNGRFWELFPLRDNDTISVEISKNKERTSPIVLDFSLLDYTLENIDVQKIHNVAIRMSAILKTNEMLYPIKVRSFPKKKSHEVLKQIAEETGLKPNIKVTNTVDNMTWLQIHKTNYDMIQHVLQRAYAGEDDTLFAYADRTGTFTVTSLKKETAKTNNTWEAKWKPDKQVIDNPEADQGQNKKENESDTDDNKTVYFSNFNYFNFAGTTNKQMTYAAEYTLYDLEKLVEETIDSNVHPFTDYSGKDKAGRGKLVRHITGTFKYNGSNTHDDYTKAIVLNKYLKEDFFASGLELYVNPTDRVKLMDIIKITIPSVINNDDINEVHSGKWLVGGITHALSKGGAYKMILVLFRNGINSSTELKSSEMRLA
jgi:hypothetical protein